MSTLPGSLPPRLRKRFPCVDPGDYVLREIDLSAYDIVSAATKVRLGYSHIFRMQRSGAIRIDGVFP